MGWFAFFTCYSTRSVQYFFVFIDQLNTDQYSDHYNDHSVGTLEGSINTYVACGVTRVLVDCSDVPPEDSLAFAWECILSEQCPVAFLTPPALTRSLAKPHMWRYRGPRPHTIVTGRL
jgi:hypothetical protein